MFKRRTRDGSEGTGTLELMFQTTEARKEIITINGCFVKNDKNLQRFIQEHTSSSFDMAPFDKNNYLFYFFNALDSDYHELNSVTTTVTYYRYSETKKEKKCEIESPQIIIVDKHSFLLCNSKEINDSKFLNDHSKRVMISQSLDVTKNVYGLSQDQKSNTKIRFIPLKMNKCESNIYSCIDGNCYEKLEDAGPILLPINVNENVVAGGYRKTDNGRISISIFGKNQDEKSQDFSDGSGKGRVKEEKGNDDENSKIIKGARSYPEENSDLEENGNNSPEQKQKKGKGNERERSNENKNASHSEDPSESEGTDNMLSKHERKKKMENEGGTSKDWTLQSEEYSCEKDFKYTKQIHKNSSVNCQPSEGLPPPQDGFEEQEKAKLKYLSDKKLLKSNRTTLDHSDESIVSDDLSYPEQVSGQLNDDIGKDENFKKYRRFLLYLALNGLSTRWQEVGQNLDIKQNQLDTIRIDCSAAEGGAREQAYQMLVHWRQSSKNPTLRLLLKALIEAEMVKQAMQITAVLKEGNNESHDGVPVKEKLLNDITRDIKNDWKFLGRYLILDENQIQSIKMENPLSTHEQAHEMLFKWKQKYARRATTRVLIKALEDVDKRPVADRVREWEKQCFQPVTRK